MLKQDQILPVGSVVTVHFREKGEDTVLVIVGHLTINPKMISRYDYTCVHYPIGIETGLIYINHDDIEAVLYQNADVDGLHEKWMTRKYAEYKAYYRHFSEEQRPPTEVTRRSILEAMNELPKRHKRKQILFCIALATQFTGAVSLTILTGEWMVGFCALSFVLAGILIYRF